MTIQRNLSEWVQTTNDYYQLRLKVSFLWPQMLGLKSVSISLYIELDSML
jgi:hypothetical protein